MDAPLTSCLDQQLLIGYSTFFGDPADLVPEPRTHTHGAVLAYLTILDFLEKSSSVVIMLLIK